MGLGIKRKIIDKLVSCLFQSCKKTSNTAAPIRLRTLFMQKVLGFNRGVYWPTHFTSVISRANRIKIGIGAAPGLSPNCYIQGIGGIVLGDYLLVAPGVGIVSASHNIFDISCHDECGVVIGKYCWIGMNAVVLPGVVLGDHTIVGAGAIVTHSFPRGHCILGGNPAKCIKNIDPDRVVERKNEFEYVGYYEAKKFKVIQNELIDVDFLSKMEKRLRLKSDSE